MMTIMFVCKTYALVTSDKTGFAPLKEIEAFFQSIYHFVVATFCVVWVTVPLHISFALKFTSNILLTWDGVKRIWIVVCSLNWEFFCPLWVVFCFISVFILTFAFLSRFRRFSSVTVMLQCFSFSRIYKILHK